MCIYVKGYDGRFGLVFPLQVPCSAYETADGDCVIFWPFLKVLLRTHSLLLLTVSPSIQVPIVYRSIDLSDPLSIGKESCYIFLVRYGTSNYYGWFGLIAKICMYIGWLMACIYCLPMSHVWTQTFHLLNWVAKLLAPWKEIVYFCWEIMETFVPYIGASPSTYRPLSLWSPWSWKKANC